MWRLWFSAAVLLALPAGAVGEFKGKVRATVGPGFDSICAATSPPRASPRCPTASLAGFLQTQGSAAVRARAAQRVLPTTPRAASSSSPPTEDTLFSPACSTRCGRCTNWWTSKGTSRRDRRGAGATSDLSADAVVGFLPDPIEVRAWRQPPLPLDRFATSWAERRSPVATADRQAPLLWLDGDFEPRRFNADRVNNPGLICPSPIERRRLLLGGGGFCNYRGPFPGSLATRTRTPAPTASARATAATHRGERRLLPLDFTVLLSGALTFASYPGRHLPLERFSLLEDDENANNASMAGRRSVAS